MSEERTPGELILNISTLFPDLPPHSVPVGPGWASPSSWKPPYICFLLALLISQLLSFHTAWDSLASPVGQQITLPFFFSQWILIDLSSSI